MNFNWNIIEWIGQMIPVLYRKERLYAYLTMLLNPLVFLHNVFFEYRLFVLKKMRFNGQIIVMENMLNDNFDELRRIRIITITDRLRKKYIYQPVEGKPLWIYQPSENQPVHIGLFQEYQNLSGYDFIVECPRYIWNDIQISQLKKMVMYYKLAGKKPKFIYQDGTEF